MKKLLLFVFLTCIRQVDYAQYTKLLDFAGTTNGSTPYGSLIQASDGMLYGMTYNGGANNDGVLFQYNPATNTYTKKLDFAGATNGKYPYSNLMQASDGMLYGMTFIGGVNNKGVLFQYNPITNTYIKKLDFAGATNGREPYSSLMQASNGMLYGMSFEGGTSSNCIFGCGVLFQYDPTTNIYTKDFDFIGATNGDGPTGSLMQANDGMLYGMNYGGANGNGVLFQYNPVSNTYTKELDFAYTTSGYYPFGSLIQASDGMLYGMTAFGGADSMGVLFQYNPTSNTYTKKLDFAGTTTGSYPYGSLMQASDGMLYGMTAAGGVDTMGVLFQYNPTTNTYTKKLDFANDTVHGIYPYGSLIQASDGMLYGMTQQGGANNMGVLFKYGIGAIGIKQIALNNEQVKVFPNPTSDQFFIQTNTTDKITVDLYDVNGRHVFSANVIDKTNINVTTLSNGIYSLTIKTVDRVINKKLVIVH